MAWPPPPKQPLLRLLAGHKGHKEEQILTIMAYNSTPIAKRGAGAARTQSHQPKG